MARKQLQELFLRDSGSGRFAEFERTVANSQKLGGEEIA